MRVFEKLLRCTKYSQKVLHFPRGASVGHQVFVELAKQMNATIVEHFTLIISDLSRGANFLLEDSEGKSPLSLVHEWCHGEMWELWKDFLFKYYKLHVDLLVFGRAGPR